MVLEDDCCGDVAAGDGGVGLDGVGGGSGFAASSVIDTYDFKIDSFGDCGGIGVARNGL